MTTKEIALTVLAASSIRDLEMLVARATQQGADPQEARAVLRELLGLPPDRPSFRAIPAASEE